MAEHVDAVSQVAIDSVGREDPRFASAFPTLSDAHIEALRKYGVPRHFPKGSAVWVAGEPNLCMFVVLNGVMQVIDPLSARLIAKHGKGGFSGDSHVLNGRPSIVSAFAETDLDVLEVEGDCTRSIVASDPELGELILRTFLLRRSLLQDAEEFGILVVGSRYSPDTLRIREFLVRNRYPFKWKDLESLPDLDVMLAKFNLKQSDTPIVMLPTGHMLKVPTNLELARALGIRREIEDKVYDLVIVGAGPAGLAAGVYGASEGLDTLVVDKYGPGGQAGTSSLIENYMGFPTGLSGQDLANRATAQAEKFGAQFLVGSKVRGIQCSTVGGHEIQLDSGEKVHARCVILAMGALYRKLEVDNLEMFEGRGVYYAATKVEQTLCGESEVVVVGGGNSAGQAAVFMSEHARKVHLVVRGSELHLGMSTYLARRIEGSPRIELRLNTEVCSLRGDSHLEGVTVRDKRSGEAVDLEAAAVFVMIGAVPHTEWLPDKIIRDAKGFVATGQSLVSDGKWAYGRSPFFLETSCPGVFAVGDVRADSVKRVASAVGEGSMAVALAHQYLAL